jgi:hypothetical protein
MVIAIRWIRVVHRLRAESAAFSEDHEDATDCPHGNFIDYDNNRS